MSIGVGHGFERSASAQQTTIAIDVG